jgi:hypothetical protein
VATSAVPPAVGNRVTGLLRQKNYKAIESVNQAVIKELVSKRYSTALVFTTLDTKTHRKVRVDIKHDWTTHTIDSLLRSYARLTVEHGDVNF